MPHTPDAPCGAALAPDIDAKRRFLRAALSHEGAPVEEIETHMSWVWLTADRVYKLKKTVRYAFLDFSTLASREFYCREEVRLNRRLAPTVYEGVLALQWRHGGLSLCRDDDPPDGATVVDWLVCMRRLPAGRMLDRLMAGHAVRTADVDAVVQVLAGFYRGAVPIEVPPDEYITRYERERSLNRDVLLRPQFALDAAAQVLHRFDAALARCGTLLRTRAVAGRIVDGHGDLRPEHVCLTDPPVIIDCLEFDARLRRVDPIDELAFLALECDIAGAGWIGERVLRGVATALDDRPPTALIHLYTAHHALLRARLAIAHLLDQQPRDPARWPPLARRYLEQARAALDALAAGHDNALGP